MSINAFPIERPLAEKIVRFNQLAQVEARGKDITAPEPSDFDIIGVLGGSGLVYIKECHADGHVTMHGKELGRAQHKANANEAKRASWKRMEQERRGQQVTDEELLSAQWWLMYIVHGHDWSFYNATEFKKLTQEAKKRGLLPADWQCCR